VGLETPRTSAISFMCLPSEYILFAVSGVSDYKSDCFSTQIKNSPANTREFFTSWRLDETTTPDNTWVIRVLLSFSDYKSDYV
jgi:hypothetical protein